MADKSPKRRWFQFRLRTLLIAILVLSVPLSWFAVRKEKARRQREAVEEIERLGGTVFYPYDGLLVPPKRTWLRKLLGNDFFDKVDSVTYVNFGPEVITDSSLEPLEGLPYLSWLCLTGTQVTDDGLKLLKGNKHLDTLILQGTQITDDGMKHLKDLRTIKYLDLTNCPITGIGLNHLAANAKLLYLDLDNTQVDDSAVEYLARLTSLQLLTIEGTQVTPEGVKKLQEALPNCKIEY